jgi:predicted kinase
MAQKFILLAGLPGSGKSTLSKQLKAENNIFVVSSDMFRLALNADVYPRHQDYAVIEKIVWPLVKKSLVYLLKAGHNVALDSTNLTSKNRRKWQKLALSINPAMDISIFWCLAQWDTSARWLNERGHTEEEYNTIRQRLASTTEIPTPEENCKLFFHPFTISEIRGNTTGKSFFGIEIPLELTSSFLKSLKRLLGNRNFNALVKEQAGRDKGSYHLTVVTPDEYEKLTRRSVINIPNKPFSIQFLGIGRVENMNNEAYFIVCESEPLETVRANLGLGKIDFHITLGFKEADIHGCLKNRASLITPCT